MFTREIEGGEDFAEENLDVTAKANTTKQSLSLEPSSCFVVGFDRYERVSYVKLRTEFTY